MYLEVYTQVTVGLEFAALDQKTEQVELLHNSFETGSDTSKRTPEENQHVSQTVHL